MQKKRERKRQDNQRMVEEEMKFLQDSGKITKTPAKKSNVKKKASPTEKQNKRKESQKEDSANNEVSPPQPNTARNMEEIFQVRLFKYNLTIFIWNVL